MDTPVAHIVIVGGGTAGWLAACLIAARADPAATAPLSVTLVESPDVPTIGVGEGTWPTMRRTLARIGIDEAEFLTACDASFKQGSRFDGWVTGAAGDSYLHPFVAPVEADPAAAVAAWREHGTGADFATMVGVQPHVCSRDLAPRQRGMPGYTGALNYAYHLDAAKFAALLTRHATERFGVRHVRDHVVGVDKAAGGDIAAVRTRASGAIGGDLFLDCTGHAALLIGGEYGVGVIDRSGELFNDRALAVQVPVAPGSPIASQTNATAHGAGWIWDIGLPTRRGVGCVYSSAHMDGDAAAATLAAYLDRTAPGVEMDALSVRRLTFRSQHRERFWVRNCLAVGLSAGFLEPLEASAIVLIELSLDALLDNFPATRGVMDIHAARFDVLFRYRWDRIVEFLKLHYVLSRRDEPYWRDHREAATIPPRLAELLQVWCHQPPSRTDFGMIDEVFPAASYQYVLYGMGFPPPGPAIVRGNARVNLGQLFQGVEQRARMLVASLPTNRAYLDALRDVRAAPAMEHSA
ncbi:tryptophan halogenase [Sphingomonas sp. Leaf339]|uniref:tryptophan halogenase family protein n=1 Tax=Sphingomonas sp. Leaf339 TaxID=1736343 RepID=UPI0006FEAD69|nr:tryptophan halogenase family protein [Sphingomonas sp. Leaf339]KQU55792.1 tryptophan halogenase [Sphingomonas sp. Leaf339]